MLSSTLSRNCLPKFHTRACMRHIDYDCYTQEVITHNINFNLRQVYLHEMTITHIFNANESFNFFGASHNNK